MIKFFTFISFLIFHSKRPLVLMMMVCVFGGGREEGEGGGGRIHVHVQ